MKNSAMKSSLKLSTNPATLEKLAEIQQHMEELCAPRGDYHEFHKVVKEYGFVKITIPQQKRR